MNVPKKYYSKAIELIQLNEKYLKVTLSVSEPDGFSFTPGQFVNIKVDETSYRSYSIISDYNNPSEISLVAAVGHDGKGANFFKNLDINDDVIFIGPSGKFTIKTIDKPIIFVATGTGIAPFISMLYQLEDQKHQQEIKMLIGMRNFADMFYVEELDNFTKSLPNFSYEIYISQPEKPYNKMGKVTDYLTFDPSSDYYLCGNPQMVDDVSNLLIQNNIQPDNIYTEKFKVIQTKVESACN